MSEQARVIFDPPASGTWNMAADQVILNSAEHNNTVTLRLYRWSEPTLSLGYFQKYEDRSKHVASQACSLVRRRSGGGAIMHDHELTYSLALPSDNRWSNKNAELYDVVHTQIVQMFAELGMATSLYRDAEPGGGELRVNDPKSFLCFQRRTSGDIVMNGAKVVGSAQRRLKHSLLQHGSLLLSQSEFAPELQGVHQLGGLKLEPQEIADRLLVRLSKVLGFKFLSSKLSNDEQDEAKSIEATVFDTAAWNQKR